MSMERLVQKVKDNSIVIGIMGQGYVGLPLSMAFAKKFKTIGFDVSEKTITALKHGDSHIKDVSSEVVKGVLGTSFFPTTSVDDLSKCDFFIICVPTPLNGENEPNLKYVENATETISKFLRKDQFVVLESTTYPGTTEEVIQPILEESGLKAGIDFGLAHSPERIDPGNTSAVEDIPKVVGGINKECTEVCTMVYGAALKHIVPVTNAKTAEAVKILENTFRCINIALINEMALIFDKMGIDTWEVVKAASTKPYGFMAFYPGPGIGGHCIPLDPYYLSYQAKKLGFMPRFIETAGEINHYMKIYAVNLAREALCNVGQKLRNSNIAVFGLSYKKNIGDARESPSSYIIESLLTNGAKVKVYDPYVSELTTKFGTLKSQTSIEETLKDMDCAIFLVDHDEYVNIDIEAAIALMKHPIIVDCKNIFKDYNGAIYSGIGKGCSQD
jgi:UDP-N-acetyl-D-glucosamine dehydrogenase